MRPDYKAWLEEQQYSSNTVTAQLNRVAKVEEFYGDLKKHFDAGSFDPIVEGLNYSADDERRKKPNPSKIPFEGNIRNNLQSYKNAIVRYRKFLQGWERFEGPPDATAAENGRSASTPDTDLSVQRLSLERDMQAALRQDIRQLGSKLMIIDDGAERIVDSGFVDITCLDAADSSLVVIELKAGKADSRAIGQILGYMGDIAEEEPEKKVRGILVAHEFDKRSKAAARVVPSLELIRYTIKFQFESEK